MIRTMSAVLIMFCLVLLHVCGSSDGLNITAGPGDDVILTCKDSQDHGVVYLIWKKDGTETKTLLVIREGRPFPAAQHESFKNRVFLKDPQMKDGDLSVVLENVEIEDSGTYQCRVGHENDPDDSPLKLISSIDLSVVPPGEEGGQTGGEDGENMDDGSKKTEGLSGGVIAVIILGVLAVPVLVVVLRIYNKKKSFKSNSQRFQRPAEC